jgi:hypothetical protein
VLHRMDCVRTEDGAGMGAPTKKWLRAGYYAGETWELLVWMEWMQRGLSGAGLLCSLPPAATPAWCS